MLKTVHVPVFVIFPYLFSDSCQIFCLQVEPCDDARGNDASDIINNPNDAIAASGIPAVKQVNIFISHSFVTFLCYYSVM